MSRSESQPLNGNVAQPHDQHQHQQFNDDSSEDEIPVPMKLSALTKALLNDGAPEDPERQPSPPRTRRRTSVLNASTSSASETRRHLRSGSIQAQERSRPESRSSRPTSPTGSRDHSPIRRRVVRLSNTPQSLNQMKPTKRRSTSMTRSTQRSRPQSRPSSRDQSFEEKHDSQLDVNTPAQRERVVRIAAGSSGNRSRVGSNGLSSGRSFDRSLVDRSGLEMESELQPEEPATVARNPPPFNHGSVSRYPSTSTRTRPEDNVNLQGSMRIKRVGKVAGSFLSGPARRGRRRQSEEEAGVNGDGDAMMSSQDQDGNSMEDQAAGSFYGEPGVHDFNSGSPVSGSAAVRGLHRKHGSYMDLRNGSARRSPREPELQPEPQPESRREPAPETRREEEEEDIHYKRSVHRPEMPSGHDQENEALASHKRTKPAVDHVAKDIPRRSISADPLGHRAASPERKPLANIAQNTPHRAAPPPPPKMSVLEAATTTAGAATTTQAKQRRNILRVNGKCYTRLDCLGRGGSAKVYRVTAENGKMFALKRVALENADESTVRGYRGEIDLLGKLTGVDRVINLFDYEMNNEKQVLTLVSLIQKFEPVWTMIANEYFSLWRWVSWT